MLRSNLQRMDMDYLLAHDQASVETSRETTGDLDTPLHTRVRTDMYQVLANPIGSLLLRQLSEPSPVVCRQAVDLAIGQLCGDGTVRFPRCSPR